MISVKKFFYSSQIELRRHAVEVRLRGLLELTVIDKPRSANVLLQMSKLVEVAGCQVGRVRWVGQLDCCSNSMSLTMACATRESRVAQAIVKDIEFDQLSYPPYSPDLTPSDFCQFRHLKQHVRGTRFIDDSELKQATESYLDSMPQEFYLTGIKELFDSCQKCTD